MPRRNLGPLTLLSMTLVSLHAQNIHIQSTKGSVQVLRGDSEHTIQRSLDAALVTDDRVVTGEQSRADVTVDTANTLQVGPQTEVKLADSYPGRCQWILTKGAVTWNVLGVSPSAAEVMTPSVSVLPRQPGVYTVAVNEQGETEITAKDGDLEVAAATGSQMLTAGQKMVARGPASDPEYQIVGASRWKKLLRILSAIQIGDVVSSITDSLGGSGGGKPHTAGANTAHSGSSLVHTPESNHPPAASGHSGPSSGGHSTQAASGGHSASTSSSAASHSSSSPSTSVSHK